MSKKVGIFISIFTLIFIFYSAYSPLLIEGKSNKNHFKNQNIYSKKKVYKKLKSVSLKKNVKYKKLVTSNKKSSNRKPLFIKIVYSRTEDLKPYSRIKHIEVNSTYNLEKKVISIHNIMQEINFLKKYVSN